jgi:hypothetical protein
MPTKLALAAAMFLLTAACGGGSPDTSATLPPVTAFVRPPVDGCTLGLGVGNGAQIVQVLEGRPAAGILEADDVVHSFAGRQIESAADLVDAVRSQTPGAVVEVEVERDGTRSTYSVALTPESVNTESQPLIGVTVVTHVDLVQPEHLDSPSAPAGELVRSLELEGKLYALDPLAGWWHAFGVAAPTGSWVGFEDDVWTLTGPGDGPVLTGLMSGRQLAIAAGEWELQVPLGELAGSIIFLADRQSTNPASTAEREPALVAIAVDTGEVSWTWIPGVVATADAQWVPVNVYSSPDQSRLLAAVAVNDGRSLGSVVLDADGVTITPWDPSAGGGQFVDLLPLGWFDDARLVFLDPTTSDTILIPVAGGTATVLNLLPDTGVEGLWPVGDGLHVMAQSGNQLNLIDEAGGSRPLAVGCSTPIMGGIGFGA